MTPKGQSLAEWPREGHRRTFDSSLRRRKKASASHRWHRGTSREPKCSNTTRRITRLHAGDDSQRVSGSFAVKCRNNLFSETSVRRLARAELRPPTSKTNAKCSRVVKHTHRDTHTHTHTHTKENSKGDHREWTLCGRSHSLSRFQEINNYRRCFFQSGSVLKARPSLRAENV